jgi:RNA 3'-terminal phosphate cyclase (ATP)
MLIQIDGSQGEGGGQILRTALALSTVTGQGFEITKIRARRARPGLAAQHLAAVRAAALISNARVGGAFEGSPDVRFEPGPITAGEYRFEISTAGAASLVLQTVLAPLATAGRGSRVEVTGGTHVPASPSFEFLSRHWAPVVERLGLHARVALTRAGFYPPGGGELVAEVDPWSRQGGLSLETRGALVTLRGVSGVGRLPRDIARRQAEAVKERLWEARRLESAWDVLEVPAASPGSFLFLEAIFEESRAAFAFLGEKNLRPEVLGDRAARTLLQFLQDDEGAVDPHLCDQLALPLALSSRGGRVSTTRVTDHLQTVANIVSLFGRRAETWGRPGGPGGIEVAAA